MAGLVTTCIKLSRATGEFKLKQISEYKLIREAASKDGYPNENEWGGHLSA